MTLRDEASASRERRFLVSTPSSLNHTPPFLDEDRPPGEASSTLLDREIPPMIRAAQAAFLRDLPQLVTHHRRVWAAYHGDRQVAIGSSKRQLFKECAAQKLPPAEFIVRLIELETPVEFDWNESRDVEGPVNRPSRTDQDWGNPRR